MKKFDEKDSGCCDKDCEYKRENYCTEFSIILIGDKDNPTRCASCNKY